MILVSEKKQQIINAFKIHDKDVGSIEVQIAMLSYQIHTLTTHLLKHKHDYAARRSIYLLIGKRKRLLKYLKRDNVDSYNKICEQLEISL